MRHRSARDRQWYRQLIFTAGLSGTLQEATTFVREAIRRRADEGDNEARELMEQVHWQGWFSFTKEELRRQGGTFMAYFLVRPRRLKRAFSTRKRDRVGNVEGTRVDLIIHKPWAELDELAAEQTVQAKTLEANVVVCRRALALRDVCPDARTPAEAAHKLGINIQAYLAGACDPMNHDVGQRAAVAGLSRDVMEANYGE